MTDDGWEAQREGLPPGFNINVPLADVGPEDAPLEYEEIGGRDSAPTLSAADRESAAARLSRGGPRQRTASRVPRE